MTQPKTYIVVGQGIAGSILAYALIKAGHKVIIIDKDGGAGSSRVAAGIYHPLVFKRTTLTWKAVELFDYLEKYYPLLEQELNAKFYHPTPYYRLFATPEERENWRKYRELDEYKTFLGEDVDTLPTADYTVTHGVGKVLRSGWVDTNAMLNAFSVFFKEHATLINEAFDYNQIQMNGAFAIYKNYQADKIIFAEGYGIKQNPYFNYLPLSPTKGQVLTIQANLPTDAIYNRKVFVLPLTNPLPSGEGADSIESAGEGNAQATFKIGATYEWQWETEAPTENIKQDLLNKLDGLITQPYTIVEHAAGVRPSVVGRRPLIGIHPQHAPLAVFNGMGSKGIMMAPYLAHEFVGFLAGQNAIDVEADIARF